MIRSCVCHGCGGVGGGGGQNERGHGPHPPDKPSNEPRASSQLREGHRQVAQRIRVLVGHGALHLRLKETEQREPDLAALVGHTVATARAAGEVVVVGLPVVVEEETGGDVHGDEDVYGVVLVGGEDEEDAEDVEDPGEGVQRVETGWSVLGDEEVEEGYHCRVTTEHVVAASTHSSQCHAYKHEFINLVNDTETTFAETPSCGAGAQGHKSKGSSQSNIPKLLIKTKGKNAPPPPFIGGLQNQQQLRLQGAVAKRLQRTTQGLVWTAPEALEMTKTTTTIK